MIVAGVMSGTSADGINVALVRIDERLDPKRRSSLSRPNLRGRVAGSHTIRFLGHAQFPYPAKVRVAVLAAMNAESARVADLARLNFLLGELYADAVLATERRFRVTAALVGCHGQTLYHQGEPRPFLGRKVAATWQTGEAAVIAARWACRLFPIFVRQTWPQAARARRWFLILISCSSMIQKVGRIVQNLGGIANLTAIPAGAHAARMFAFDTGPGNMVIDAVTEALFGRAFDRDGKIAAEGMVLKPVLENILKRKFFRAKPPKTAGREEFGREFVRDFLAPVRGFSQRRCCRYRHGTHGAVDWRRATAVCDRETGLQQLFSRDDSLRRRRSECHAGCHAERNPCAARNPVAIFRRVRFALGGERSGRVCRARLRNVESAAV